MRLIKSILLLFLFLFVHQSIFCITRLEKPITAVITVPVADLFFQPMAKLFPNSDVDKSYQNIPLEGVNSIAHSCARAHQLLFHEQVEIISKQGDERLIRIPQLFYLTHQDKKTKRNEYWTHKKYLISLNKLKKEGVDLNNLPQPISFCATQNNQQQNIATLLFPINDKEGHSFSAGTRFVYDEKYMSADAIRAWAIDAKSKQLITLLIPKKIALLNNIETKKRKFLVWLLKQWATLSSGFIPYVWGGNSFTRAYTKKMIATKPLDNKRPLNIFLQNDTTKTTSGFDCSGLIARASQIVGLPYFFKNSFTAAQQLKSINNFKELKNGDLLYFSGHIMVVSDIKNNKIIEARSHYHGFGKLHEIRLNKVFKEIYSYKELFKACKEKKMLSRLDSTGKEIMKIKPRLLSLTNLV